MQGLMMDYPLTVDRILEHASRLYPRKRVTTKLPDGSLHRYTYADLKVRVGRAANVLRHLGVQPGDRVGTFAWNNFQHLELYYAIPWAGAVCHTLNIRLFPELLAQPEPATEEPARDVPEESAAADRPPPALFTEFPSR